MSGVAEGVMEEQRSGMISNTLLYSLSLSLCGPAWSSAIWYPVFSHFSLQILLLGREGREGDAKLTGVLLDLVSVM